MDDVSASCTALTIEYQYTYNAVGVNVRDICRNTRCTTDIVQRKRGNIRVELEQERKRLANASARAEYCDLGVGADDEFGGPLAQADFCGSGVGSFGADATEDLLILPADWQIDTMARACRMSTIWVQKGWEIRTNCDDLYR